MIETLWADALLANSEKKDIGLNLSSMIIRLRPMEKGALLDTWRALLALDKLRYGDGGWRKTNSDRRTDLRPPLTEFKIQYQASAFDRIRRRECTAADTKTSRRESRRPTN